MSATLAAPSVTVGGAPATVSFSALAPGYVGLYQVNAQVPGAAVTGAAVPMVVTIGGVTSNVVTIAVGQMRMCDAMAGGRTRPLSL